MLFYADDMVLWGKSKAELEEKMKTVIGTMEQLGLEVSTSKTEIQKTTQKVEAEEELVITTNKGTKHFKYTDPNKTDKIPGIMVHSRYGR